MLLANNRIGWRSDIYLHECATRHRIRWLNIMHIRMGQNVVDINWHDTGISRIFLKFTSNWTGYDINHNCLYKYKCQLWQIWPDNRRRSKQHHVLIHIMRIQSEGLINWLWPRWAFKHIGEIKYGIGGMMASPSAERKKNNLRATESWEASNRMDRIVVCGVAMAWLWIWLCNEWRAAQSIDLIQGCSLSVIGSHEKFRHMDNKYKWLKTFKRMRLVKKTVRILRNDYSKVNSNSFLNLLKHHRCVRFTHIHRVIHPLSNITIPFNHH